MLILKMMLDEIGETAQSLADETEVSRSAISALLNHGTWPKKDHHLLHMRIRKFLKLRGLKASDISKAFRTYEEESDKPIKKSDLLEIEYMLLKKQTLTPAARRHFNVHGDLFGPLTDASQVFDTPETRYVRAALAQTLTDERFIAVIGESGAGKSTLRRDLIDKIQKESAPITVIEPYVLGLEDNDLRGKCLKAADIANAIIRTLDPVTKVRMSTEARFAQLHNLLRESRRSGQRHILIIEEAHSLSIPTLKHLKRFYELEDGFNRLLSIVLIGQTELGKKLSENRSDVREVVQRIEQIKLESLDTHLANYIAHRLKSVGVNMADVIEPSAIDQMQIKMTVPARDKRRNEVSLMYPLAVGNQVIAAMNTAADLGSPRVTADIIKIC